MHKDRVIGLIALLIGVLLMAATLALPASNMFGDPGPQIFPGFAACLLMLFGAILAVQKKPEQKAAAFLSKEEWLKLGLLFLVLILYVLGLSTLGFLLSTPLMLFATSSMFAQGHHIPPLRLALFSVLLSVLLYLLFVKVLGVILPAGILSF